MTIKNNDIIIIWTVIFSDQHENKELVKSDLTGYTGRIIGM